MDGDTSEAAVWGLWMFSIQEKMALWGKFLQGTIWLFAGAQASWDKKEDAKNIVEQRHVSVDCELERRGWNGSGFNLHLINQLA